MNSTTPLTPSVVVIGNVGIDTNVYLYGADIDFSVEANFSDNRDYVGQAGGYTSRGYAALGAPTAFIGHVGDDFSGRFIRETLAADGIDSRALFTDPAGTARSVNFMYRDGRRKNFYDGKGHMTLMPDLDLCRKVLRGARLAHFHLPNWARRLLPIAREEGLTIACDLQDVVDPADPYRQDFIREADILFFSAANFPDPTPL
ncbi:carbohydrate kinase family protein, partial [Promineifilum sp.]|uniref:carbohydrate kinase family protein n=1 Tax=Promineifilum sp. TaxID=2664178 RepID=UPI0035ADA798